LSRVYVGGHIPLDIIGRIPLGVGVSLIFIGIHKLIESLMVSINDKEDNKRVDVGFSCGHFSIGIDRR